MLRPTTLLAALSLAAALSPAQSSLYPREVRTADIYVRGLKPSDFPRMTKLAPNVYVYEAFQVMPNIEHVFITNCFVVVTSDGVLIADALETEEDVRALIAAVAKITPQPIKYVVIGADHIDHTGGDAAFPSSVKFIAHPTSIATLQRRADDPRRSGSAPKVVIPTDALPPAHSGSWRPRDRVPGTRHGRGVRGHEDRGWFGDHHRGRGTSQES